MGKRQPSRQQRRVCPDHRQHRQEQPPDDRQPEPPKQPRLTRSGLPVLRGEDLLFGDTSAQESFAELFGESLAAPPARQSAEEKQPVPSKRQSGTQRPHRPEEPTGDKSIQESFAELLEESLAAPEVRQALQEKRLAPRKRRSEAERLREYPAPQAELDLHGLTGPEAATRIERFVQTARGLKLATLRIITGRGLHSEGPAVLPDVTEHQLMALLERGLLRAYRWEKKGREQSGAAIVYLM
ncbi:MAG: Smr/MutS family protein [Desulfobacteraceae bacterium]|nr:Smr/MutS family protein [Desulfobacteraceae bacterium]